MATEYELTEQEYQAVRAASRPVPYLVVGGREPFSPQDHANAVWQRIAAARGCRWDSIGPSHRGDRWFTAEPT